MRKPKPYPRTVKKLMAEKTAILSKAQALSEMGLAQTALPLWTSAASYEERLAPLLETLRRDKEAAVHQINAASCYLKAGEFSAGPPTFSAPPWPAHCRRTRS